MDPAHSRLTFFPTVSGGRFEGHFERFATDLRFDPADLAHSSLRVDVDLLSARTGDEERDGALQGTEFFDTRRWPHARFECTTFTVLGPGRYEARGRLTLRDAARDVRVAFTFEPGASPTAAARMAGGTTLQRLQFGVGQGDWRDTRWLADAVEVRFDLLLQPAY